MGQRHMQQPTSELQYLQDPEGSVSKGQWCAERGVQLRRGQQEPAAPPPGVAARGQGEKEGEKEGEELRTKA